MSRFIYDMVESSHLFLYIFFISIVFIFTVLCNDIRCRSICYLLLQAGIEQTPKSTGFLTDAKPVITFFDIFVYTFSSRMGKLMYINKCTLTLDFNHGHIIIIVIMYL